MLSAASRRLTVAGFTLIELMVTIAVLAVLLTVAAPSFNSQVANYRTRTGAEGIVNGLQLARSEAIRRNTDVSFTLNSGTGWTVAVVSPASTIQVRPASEAGTNLQISSLNDQATLSFTPMGTVFGYSVSTNLTRVTVAPPASATNADSYQIDVFAGGQIRMCNTAISAANDPRKC
jgi:type IV fimbrial biogenesis protein FimT